MKYLILLSLILARCGNTKTTPRKNFEEDNKKNNYNRNILKLFQFFKEGKLEEFNKEINKFSLEELNTIHKDKTLLMISAEKGYNVRNFI